MRPHGLLFAVISCAGLAACGTTYSANYDPDAGGDARRTDARADVHPDISATDAIDPIDGPDVTDPARDASADGATVGHGPPYPIILHHGFGGFRDIGPINYFYNVGDDLRARGEVVYESEVSPFNPPEVRGPELAAFVDHVLAETGSAKVVIIGHSQGGLDARYLISSLHYGDRVAQLVTVATPHRGSYVADAILGNVPGVDSAVLDAVASLLGFSYNDVRTMANLHDALVGLSVDHSSQFNFQNPDDPRVVYWSWAGRSNNRTGETQCGGARIPNQPDKLDATNAILYPFDVFMEQNDPVLHVNDGMVEVRSARWGVFMGCVPADHFDEVGQIAQSGPDPQSGFDHIEFYRDVVQRVRAAGF